MLCKWWTLLALLLTSVAVSTDAETSVDVCYDALNISDSVVPSECGPSAKCECVQTCMICSNKSITSLSFLQESSYEDYTVLDLSFNTNTAITSTTFAKLTKLEFLFLANMSISTIAESAFELNKKLKLLSLDQNVLSSIPRTYSKDLQFLSLTGNQIIDPAAATMKLNSLLPDVSTFVLYAQLSDNPITCVLTDLRGPFYCKCSELYNLQGTTCKAPPPGAPTSTVVGAALGGIVGGISLVIFALIAWRYRHLRKNLDLSERLLDDRISEVETLKNAWTIHPEDINLVKRIDGDDAGTFGEVWLGNWDGIDVAVKRLREILLEFDDLAPIDFEKEVDFLRTCRHRNIVRFFGAGHWDAVPFLVIEYLSVGSLSVYLQQHEDILWKQRLKWMLDISAGMAYIHSLDRMHRDLKTSNVLLSDKLRAKVCDFGSIRDLFMTRIQQQEQADRKFPLDPTSKSMPELTAGVGTPMYMALEVMRGDAYGQPADIWAFGVVLYEIATRVRPDKGCYPPGLDFNGPFMLCLQRILTAGHRLQIPNREALPQGLTQLMNRCWELVPSTRPSFVEIDEEITNMLEKNESVV